MFSEIRTQKLPKEWKDGNIFRNSSHVCVVFGVTNVGEIP